MAPSLWLYPRSLARMTWHPLFALPLTLPLHPLPSLVVLATCSWQCQELGHILHALWLHSWTCSWVLGGCKTLLYWINASCSLTLRLCHFQSTKKGLLTQHQLPWFFKKSHLLPCAGKSVGVGARYIYTHTESVCMHVIEVLHIYIYMDLYQLTHMCTCTG